MFLASSKEVITVEKSLLTRKANEFPFRLRLVSFLSLTKHVKGIENCLLAVLKATNWKSFEIFNAFINPVITVFFSRRKAIKRLQPVKLPGEFQLFIWSSLEQPSRWAQPRTLRLSWYPPQWDCVMIINLIWFQ